MYFSNLISGIGEAARARVATSNKNNQSEERRVRILKTPLKMRGSTTVGVDRVLRPIRPPLWGSPSISQGNNPTPSATGRQAALAGNGDEPKQPAPCYNEGIPWEVFMRTRKEQSCLLKTRLAVACAAVLLCATATAAEMQSLAGKWDFRRDDRKTGEQAEWFAAKLDGAQTIDLPGAMDAAKLGVSNPERPSLAGLYRPNTYEGMAWYERQIDVPETWRGKRVTLFLEARALGHAPMARRQTGWRTARQPHHAACFRLGHEGVARQASDYALRGQHAEDRPGHVCLSALRRRQREPQRHCRPDRVEGYRSGLD